MSKIEEFLKQKLEKENFSEYDKIDFKLYTLNVINSFQRACYSAFNKAIYSNLTHSNFCRLFCCLEKFENIKIFLSKDFIIIFSPVTN